MRRLSAAPRGDRKTQAGGPSALPAVALVCLALALLLATAGPLMAWLSFTAVNGQRMQWVFGSSCNTASRPITVYVDSDTPTTHQAQVTGVLLDWNNPQGKAINLLSSTATLRTMSTSEARAFLSTPNPNEIWVAYDTDGSLLASLGVTSNSILGVGLPISPNLARPQDICGGLIIMNGRSGSAVASDSAEYQKTLLHELGHVLGFAHNVAGANGSTVAMVTVSNGVLTGSGAGKLPVMYPFALTGSASTLHPDDEAGAYAVYGQ